jgi:uncharacterized protein (TIRG00374 family)
VRLLSTRPWIWRGIVLLVLVVVIWLVLVPQFRQATDAWRSLGLASLPLALTGLVLEFGALVSYSGLTRSSLARGRRPGFFTILRIDLSCLGVLNTVPAGGATAAAAKFRLMTLVRTSPADALAGQTIEATTSTLSLGGIFVVGILASLSTLGDNAGYFVAGGVVFLVVTVVAAGAALFAYRRAGMVRIVTAIARRVPFVSEESALALATSIADDFAEYRRDLARILSTWFWATLNWSLDAAALWTMLAAFGFHASLPHLLVVYGLVNILAMLPITPGGLGIVEGVLVPALVGFGTPHGIALLAVIAWRVVQFWMPIFLAALAYGSLRVGILRRSEPKPVAA